MMLEVREYGDPGAPVVITLHGGPGARGYMAPVSRELATEFHVLEPLQRLASDGDVTVAAHVQDLHEIVAALGGSPPALVGSSWGAMLALAYAAEHPASAGPLVLIGCGTFDLEARAVMAAEEERRLEELTAADATLDPDSPEALLIAYSFDLLTHDQELERVDWEGMTLAWEDMVRLQQDGPFPRAFKAIRSPALMLHGSHDPLPGPMIRDGLKRHIPQLEYVEFERCGHYPWLERHARNQFVETLTAWLRAQSIANAPTEQRT